MSKSAVGPAAPARRSLAGAAGHDPDGGTRGSRRPHDRLWRTATLVLVVGLAGASVLAGIRWRSDVAHERAAVFKTTASAVASSVATTLSRQTDLTSFEQTMLSINPDLDNAEYTRWLNDLGATHYTGGLGFGFVKVVPADQLDAFAAEVKADPTPALKVTGDYKVFPAGQRSQYCLLRLTVWLRASSLLPQTLDYCAPSIPMYGASPTATTLATARDTGKLTLAAPVSVFPGVMFAFMPVYQGGATPPTVEARRAKILGWVAGTFDGKAIISAADAGHKDLRVEVVARIGEHDVVLASEGATPTGRVSSLKVPIDTDGAWWVSVSGAVVAGGMSATDQGIVVGALGVVISLLVLGVTEALMRGRRHALRLVEEKTAELRYRALHDDLTGLPNRALIMDRLDQLLSRVRRTGAPAAVLFIDLDSFKDVNDTHGHAVGDALLREIARRLTRTLRDSDTAGRIGGDEFIVLAEGPSLDDGAAAVAARLLDVLREPVTLDELPDVVLTPQASVGVALVGGESPDVVLRNADLALYEAKAAGKSRFMVFSD